MEATQSSNHVAGFTVEDNTTTKEDNDNDNDNDNHNENENNNNVNSNINNEEPKTDYKDYPLKNIPKPLDHDVMFGRGAGTNYHIGNKLWREIVASRKIDYIKSEKLAKPLVPLEIIRQWRELKPPGRFLKKDKETKLWNDVGDAEAKRKTSQALRENAVQIKKELIGGDGGPTGDKTTSQSTEGTKKKKKLLPNLSNWKKDVKNFMKDPLKINNNRTTSPRPDALGKFRFRSDCSSMGTIEKSFGSKIRSMLTSTPPPPPEPCGDYAFSSSSSSMGKINQPAMTGQHRQQPQGDSEANPYAINITDIAQMWKRMGGGATQNQPSFGQPKSDYDGQSPLAVSSFPYDLNGNHSQQKEQGQNGHLARPAMMEKRDISVSHQQRTSQRPKKPALNRDQSETSNRLKTKYFPQLFSHAMESLHVHEMSSERSHEMTSERSHEMSSERSQLNRHSTEDCMGMWARETEDSLTERSHEMTSERSHEMSSERSQLRRLTTDDCIVMCLCDETEDNPIAATVTPYNSDRSLSSTGVASHPPSLLDHSNRLSTEQAFDQLVLSNDKVSEEVNFTLTMGNVILPGDDATSGNYAPPPKHASLKQTSSTSWALFTNATSRNTNSTTPPRGRPKPSLLHGGDRKTSWAKSMNFFKNQRSQRHHHDHDRSQP